MAWVFFLFAKLIYYYSGGDSDNNCAQSDWRAPGTGVSACVSWTQAVKLWMSVLRIQNPQVKP